MRYMLVNDECSSGYSRVGDVVMSVWDRRKELLYGNGSVGGVSQSAMVVECECFVHFVFAREDAPYMQLKVSVGKSLEASLARLRKKLQEEEEKRKEETSNTDGTGSFPSSPI